MCNPPVSVLMSCFNASQFAEGAIKSILSQSFHDFELILIDDGSTDSTKKILHTFAAADDRVIIIEKDRNTGLADSLNKGLKLARGEFIARMDADDIALPNRLREQMRFMEKHPQYALIGSGCIVIDEKGKRFSRYRFPSSRRLLLGRIEHMLSAFPHSSYLFKKQGAVKIGNYNMHFRVSQDADFFLRIAEHNKIFCMDAPLVLIRKRYSDMHRAERELDAYLFGVAAIICHFRREWGLTDPSLTSDSSWENFMTWLTAQIREFGYFKKIIRKIETRKLLCRVYSKNRQLAFYLRALSLAHHFTIDNIFSILNRRDDAALTLARESAEYDF